ncbi:mechanosensitive ion channel family protein [Devosia rhizoryzae]|uniref:Mechanosensitive ion channel n=1 Tax=Devosia rhizoryzae TaxID=2774137 RepID=A0ABX7CAH9_9HYPH|nr:mechanosensitive ion channel domain-containing protein [Devosia rhizoryzae]QQR41221.1 mechanosensitive ion channel [Devosia rhizoryzae]
MTRELVALHWNEWTLLQLALVGAAWLWAQPLGRWLERRLEEQARRIKGNPDLLRLAVTLIRRSRLLVFVVSLLVLRLVLLAADLPEATLAIVLLLSAAWLFLSVATRIIRNRTLARLVALIGWIYVALLVLDLTGPVFQALDYLAISIGEFRISALLLLRAGLVTAGVIWCAIFISHIIENRLKRSDDVSPSAKVLFSKLVRIGLVIGAGAFALSASGVDLTALTVVSGAIGVGIGFGLQKVVSNFISGIIILLDRSVKPGDTIAVGDTFGWIVDLRARFVSVMTRDGRKYLIPNEDFITKEVINWSYSDENVRVDVEFGVAYDSDPHQVTAIAIVAAQTVERVSSYKEPVCWLTGFSASSLDFKLRFWITDPRNGLTNVRGQVLMALWDAFKQANIEIPFPQSDIRFRTPLEIKRSPLPDDF